MKSSKNTGSGNRPSGANRGSEPRQGAGSQARRVGNGISDEWIDDSGRRDEGQSFSNGPQSFEKGDDRTSAAKLADGIRDAATTTAGAVKEQSAAIINEVGHEFGKTVEEQMGRGADAIRGFARAIDAASSELERQSPQIARMVADTASKMRNVSDGLGNREVKDLIGVANDFARTQPAVFFGIAVATGFALARFLKSSAHNVGAPDRAWN